MRAAFPLFTVLTLAAFTLTACTASTVDTEPEPEPSVTAVSSSPVASASTPQPSVDPSVSASETITSRESATATTANHEYSDAELQAWADEKLQQWMDDINEGWEDVVMDIDEPKDFLKWYPTDPHGHMYPFEAPAYGELLITLEPYAWETDAYSDLAYVGSNTMLRIGEHDKDLRQVTVVTEDGQFEYVATREDWPPHGDY